ncbi:MAG TPA: HPr kinase/phosphatase C-terminal domain-containing protein [Allosphingosinicella sp.]|nr:HPr kinase/phosphatase C-terminal domain-containing protein [Allosphingosinicella sp.]
MKDDNQAETIHASCVAIGGRAVLLGGPSGSGKSDLAIRLIDRGAVLVSDDYTLLRPASGGLIAAAPTTIRGSIELRGVGLVSLPSVEEAPVALYVALSAAPQRLPELQTIELAGIELPLIALSALEASAPIKVEAALNLIGLEPK